MIALRTTEVPGAWGADSKEARAAYEKRSDAVERAGGDSLSHCVICGRKVNPARGFAVHLVAGGNYALLAADEATHVEEGGEMGWWALGSECAKKVPAEYRHPLASAT